MNKPRLAGHSLRRRALGVRQPAVKCGCEGCRNVYVAETSETYRYNTNRIRHVSRNVLESHFEMSSRPGPDRRCWFVGPAQYTISLRLQLETTGKIETGHIAAHTLSAADLHPSGSPAAREVHKVWPVKCENVLRLMKEGNGRSFSWIVRDESQTQNE